MKIKRLGINDQFIAEKLFLFFQTEDEILSPYTSSEEWRNDLLKDENFIALVAIEEEELIGGLTAYILKMYKRNYRKAFLYEISVKDGFRRQGIGKKLINFLKEILNIIGTESIILITSKSNDTALKFYTATNGALKSNELVCEYLL